MDNDEIEQTVICDFTTESSIAENEFADVSRANVGFVAGAQPKFADETTLLLRRRLTSAALAMAVILAAAFVGNLVNGVFVLWWLRASIFCILSLCYLSLRGGRSFTLPQLRIVEYVVFGLASLQVASMFATRIARYAAEGDATSVVAAQYLLLAAWCVLILIYAIFMPNTWKRGTLILLPSSTIPYIVLAVQRWWSADIAILLDQSKLSSAVPLPIIAALVGVYGTHIINSARREAFKSRQFGQYRLLDKLGSGGMGEVYRAEHVLLKRPCAMKLIRPSSEADATAIAHFEKEVMATAKLTHWNTIEIFDYGHTEDCTFYYVMELLPGMSLEELVEQHGPLPSERVVHLLRQVCGALNEAHSVGLIHRDIKPANIFAAQRGGVFDVAKLLDFGLVKEKSEGSSETQQSSFSGTPLYMSPEQASAYEGVDARADIYSLGAVAYHLLTGKPPFAGKNVIQLLTAHANREVIPLSTVNPEVPEDVNEVVLKCLAKKPGDRYQNAATLEKAFARCHCADKWTSEKAAAWWKAQRPSPKRSASDRQDDATVVVVDRAET